MSKIVAIIVALTLAGCSGAQSTGSADGRSASASSAPAARGDRFLASDEAKESTVYKQGCAITDYSNLVEGDGVNWAWVDPSMKIGAPGAIAIGPVKNRSDVTDTALAGKLEDDLKAALERVGKSSGKGGLKADTCIYWVQRADVARAWIPYAGSHMMQAGIGVEMTLSDSSGRPVAKIRHDGRQGMAPADAAAEVADDIANFIRAH